MLSVSMKDRVSMKGLSLGAFLSLRSHSGLCYSVLWPLILVAPKSCSSYVGDIFLPFSALSHGLQWPMTWSPLYMQVRLLFSLLLSFPHWPSHYCIIHPFSSCPKAFQYPFACLVFQSRSLHLVCILSPLSNVFPQKPSLTTLRNNTFLSVPFSFSVLSITLNNILCPPR